MIDRTNEISSWVDVCYETVRRGVKVFGYANNHYGGHAPATIRQFRELWRGKGLPEIGKTIQNRQRRGRFLICRAKRKRGEQTLRREIAPLVPHCLNLQSASCGATCEWRERFLCCDHMPKRSM